MGFGILAAAGIQAGAGLVGGLLGRHDSRQAKSDQEEYIERAILLNSQIADKFRSQADAALGLQGQAVDVLSALPKEIAQGFDAGLATELNRMVGERKAEQARASMQAARMGLGGTTIAGQVRRAIDRQAGRAFAETSARFAQARGGAVAGATGMYAGALSQQAGMTADFAARTAAIRQFAPNLLGNVQIAPPNTGAEIGGIGAGIGSLLGTHSLMQMLAGGGGGGGGGTGQIDWRAGAIDDEMAGGAQA